MKIFIFRVTCSSSKLFEFCWTLFVVAKSEFPDLSENLVNSYHLLLACCDYVYTNVLMADLRDLLNKSFGGNYLLFMIYIMKCINGFLFCLRLAP